MQYSESSVFVLVVASLVACVQTRNPAANDEVDDEGIEVGHDSDHDDHDDEHEDQGDSESSEDDGGGTNVKFDELADSGGGEGTAEGGDNIVDGCKKVDLLFVIDDSGSMEDEQINLVGSVPSFIDEIQLQLADTESYHIGVISTDDYEFNANCVEQEGALITQTGGEASSNKPCGPFVEGHTYMTEMDDLDVSFACAAQIGIDGDSDERGLQTLQVALSADMNAPGGCNDGFLRDDALLVVVIITDEEDDHELDGCAQQAYPGSGGEPADWYAGVIGAKAGMEKNIVVLSLIGPTGPDPAMCPMLDKCSGGVIGAEVGARIEEFTSMFTHGFIGRVCEPSYASFFQEAVAVIKSACDDFDPIQ